MALPEYQWLKEKNLLPENLKIASQLNLLAQQLNTTLPKLAIAWCAQNPNVSTVILGATRLEQLEETIESLDALPLLTKEVNEQIENILNNKPATTPY